MPDRETLLAVRRMQDCIEAHLHRPLTMKMLADAAGYSPWHAARIFREATGEAPFTYLRALRLSRAALTLRDEKTRVLDVALDFEFDSHEGFTRAFSRQFGLSPRAYSRQTPPIRLFLPYPLQLPPNKKEESQMAVTKTVFVQVMERPRRKVLLKRGVKATEYFAYCEEVGCDIWPLLVSVKEALYEPVGMWLPQHLIAPGTSQYVQGVEVPLDYANEVPQGLEVIELPACKMMVFQSEPYNDDDFSEAIGEVWEHIEHFDPVLYGYRWAPEAAPRFQLAPLGCRGYIEARPVEAVR
ncbi:MAG: AraC family transcriptional regulator [Eubacteriales bacterium]|nr:AraC family transcriptional regulator [Eubacteriales bacterium]